MKGSFTSSRTTNHSCFLLFGWTANILFQAFMLMYLMLIFRLWAVFIVREQLVSGMSFLYWGSKEYKFLINNNPVRPATISYLMHFGAYVLKTNLIRIRSNADYYNFLSD